MSRFFGLRSLLAMFLLVMTAGDAHSSRQPLTTACLVSQADLIVIGTVESISDEPILRDEFGSVFVADVSVQLTLKGEVMIEGKRSDHLFLAVRLDLSGQAHLLERRRYALFVKSSEAGPHVLNGGQGAQELTEEHAGQQQHLSDTPRIVRLREDIASGIAAGCETP